MNKNHPEGSGGATARLRRSGDALVAITPNGERIYLGTCMACEALFIPDESVPETLLEYVERTYQERKAELLSALRGGPYEWR